MAKDIEQSKAAVIEHIDAMHYRNSPDHGRIMLDNLWRKLGSFLDRRSPDPLLFAYTIRDERSEWTQMLNEVFAWSDAVLDADAPDVDSEGVR